MRNEQFTLDEFFGEDLTKKTEGTQEVTSKMTGSPSEGQIKYYKDLCVQKNKPEEDTTTMTKAEIDARIKALQKLPNWKPVSENQIAKIKEYCELLGMKEPDYDKLDGTYNGSASKLIGQLIEMAKNRKAPISEPQKEFILSMMICPDIEDVRERLDKMQNKEADTFIKENRLKYFEWKNSRLTPAQANLIKSLQEQIGDAILEDYQLIQFSRDQASKYIDQLQRELADKSLRETTLEPEQIIEKNISIDKKMSNLVHKLYASIGQDVPDGFIETLTWDTLKDLVQFVKAWENPSAILEKSKLFNDEQIANLIG